MDNFKSKEEFFYWLKNGDKEDIKKHIGDVLLKRKQEKGLLFSPCQVELRSLGLPGIKYLNGLYDNYYNFCKDIGFINKYKNFIEWENEKISLNKKRKIFIDTREQNLLKFKKVKTEVKTLSYGDYSFSDKNWMDNIVIERKSLSDFIGTMFSGYNRFIREIERAKKDKAFLIILVEANLSDALDYKKKRLVNYHIRIPPVVIFHNVRKLIQQYDNIQFLFTDSHYTAGLLVEKLFSLGGQIKKYDLQLLLDLKLL